MNTRENLRQASAVAVGAVVCAFEAAAVLAAAGCHGPACESQKGDPSGSINIATYNIRRAGKPDVGERDWTNRLPLVVGVPGGTGEGRLQFHSASLDAHLSVLSPDAPQQERNVLPVGGKHGLYTETAAGVVCDHGYPVGPIIFVGGQRPGRLPACRVVG